MAGAIVRRAEREGGIVIRSSLLRHPAAPGAAFALGLLVFATPATPGDLPPCVAGTEVTFAPTGGVQSYAVPPNAIEILVEIAGASGGDAPPFPGARAYGDPGVPGGGFVGGPGVQYTATVPVVGPLDLSVIVGERGEDGEIPTRGEKGEAPGGGGGGSFVYADGPVLYFAAGGGGGAGITDDGHIAVITEDGNDADPPFGGAGGTNGSGGGASTQQASNSGGGGGFLGAGGDGAGPGSGFGGHRISPPGDAAGGAGDSFAGDGGFGGGGGAGGPGGGGGGGYSGGGGGWGEGVDGGGGGGSFLAPGSDYFVIGPAPAGSDGLVRICVTAEGTTTVLEVPAVSPGGLAGLGALLAAAAFVVLRRRAHS
jgi:hypothetical protein